MKLIKADAFSIFTTEQFVYYICNDPLNDRLRFYKTDIITTLEINIDEYAYDKFGKSWSTLHSPFTECIHLTNGEYITCLFHDSKIIRHNRQGEKIHKYNIAPLETGFDTIYSITLDKHGYLWISQPSSHCVGQYVLDTEKLIFSIGGDFDNPGVFNYPEEVRCYGDQIYVCDMGNKRVCKLNVDTKELSEYLRFNEPVFEYSKFNDLELVKLKSGLYLI